MLRYATHVDLSKNNTLNLPCIAHHYLELASADDVADAFHRFPEIVKDFLILGEASNVMLPPVLDSYVLHFAYQPPESVRLLPCEGSGLSDGSGDTVCLEVDAGVIWDEFVAFCVAHGWHGLENLSLIPGSVGAAPIQNIGAYGVEVADTLREVRVFDVLQQKQLMLSAEQCQFGYRDSLFKQQPGRYIILSLQFCLSKMAAFNLAYGELAALKEREHLTLADVRQAVVAARQAKLPDPKILPNAGSFFKNPVVSAQQAERLKAAFPELIAYPQANGQVKLAAGWLIERAGWKGYRNQTVGVHERQALVLVNHHRGNRDQLLALAQDIRHSVEEMFEVHLDIEPLVLLPV
jgi:UDP-N-acetylmuramate dehydrogenase